ncbi:TRAP transporter small permease [Anaerotruncus rubiinfantis]|uniref:TRAP transporter small permease n=1 Tax=Anaerotruncus rubiinfantis TaxID=1720200 RepID=UPI0034A5754E
MKTLKKILNNLEEYVAIVLFAAMVILIFLQIIFRFVFNFSLSWTEELARYTFVFLVYISASIAVKRGRHLKVEALQALLPAKISFCLWVLANLIWIVFNAIMVVVGFQMASEIFATGQSSPVLSLPMGMVYMIIPVCYLLIEIRVLQSVAKEFVPRALGKPLTEGPAQA